MRVMGWLFLLICFKIYAQQPTCDYAQVDSSTYQAALLQDWKTIIAYEPCIDKQFKDIFYLNLRLGMACFHEKMYSKAEKYLQRATRKNASDEILNTYWAELFKIRGNYMSANYYLRKYKFGKPLQYHSVSSQAGVKISDNSELASNLLYVGGQYYGVMGRLALNYNPLLYAQNLLWGSYLHKQHYVSVAMSVLPRIIPYFGMHYSHNFSQLNNTSKFSTYNRYEVPSPSGMMIVDSTAVVSQDLKTKYHRFSLIPTIGATLILRKLHFSAEFQYLHVYDPSKIYENTVQDIYLTKGIPPLPPQNFYYQRKIQQTIKKDTTITQYQVNCKLTLPFLNYKLLIGARASWLYNYDFQKVIAIPFIFYQPYKRISLMAEFLQKSNFLLSDYSGQVYYSNYDDLTKLTMSMEFMVNQNLALGLTYTYEDIKDFIIQKKYLINGIIFQIKYQL